MSTVLRAASTNRGDRPFRQVLRMEGVEPVLRAVVLVGLDPGGGPGANPEDPLAHHDVRTTNTRGSER